MPGIAAKNVLLSAASQPAFSELELLETKASRAPKVQLINHVPGISIFGMPEFKPPVFFQTPLDIRVASAAIASMLGIRVHEWDARRKVEIGRAVKLALEKRKAELAWMAEELRAACKADREKMAKMLGEFEKRAVSDYGKGNICSALLVVIEESEDCGGEPGVGRLFPGSGRVPGEPKFAQNEAEVMGWAQSDGISRNKASALMLERARKSPNVRIASLREMLSIYFSRNPKEYEQVLRLLLGLSQNELEQPAVIEQAVKREVAKIGRREFVRRLLEKLKKLKAAKFSDAVPYFHDKKSNVFVVCPKCHSPASLFSTLAKLLQGKQEKAGA